MLSWPIVIMEGNERLKRIFIPEFPFKVRFFFVCLTCGNLTCLVLDHSELNPRWWITIYSTCHPKPSQHTCTPTHTTTTNAPLLAALPCCLLSRLDLCVARAHAFHRLHSSLCGSITEVNPLLPGNRIKQWSQWDIAKLMDSPPPPPHLRFSCAKVFIESWWRQPCMTLIHLNGPEKKNENLSHTCRVGRKQFRRVVLNQHFYLKMVFVYCFNVSRRGSGVVLVDFSPWWLYSAIYSYPTTWQATSAGK